MSDRVVDLIAEVQADIPPRSAIPADLVERWPGAAHLPNAIDIEEIEWLGPSESGVQASPAVGDKHDGEETVWNPAGAVTFPEGMDGVEVLEASLPPTDIQSIDALAFYLPFHVHRNWGIYILEEGLLATAALLDERAHAAGTGVPPGIALDAAFRILWNHEHFHFLTEVACARLGSLAGAAAYLAYFRDPAAAFDEEALANAYALRRFCGPQATPTERALRRHARRWMKTLGPGYRDFPAFERSEGEGRDRQVDRMGQALSRRRPIRLAGRLLFQSIAHRPPTYLVRQGHAVVSLVREFPKWGPLRVWAYTDDHHPPHVHTGTGPGDTSGHRFEWPSRADMDGAPARVVRQFADYADRHAKDITAKVDRINWKTS